MGLSDILYAALIIGMGILIFFTVYAAVSYLELKSVINDCNSEMGVGNWTFVHESKWPYDQYSCRSYKQDSYITSSISTTTYKQCFENGKEIPCG